MIEQIKYNWRIYCLLRRVSKQRVTAILQPGNVWLVELAIPDDEATEALLRTCFMRGWVDTIQNEIPKGKLEADGSLPSEPIFQSSGPLWKLTDSGWAAINRTHQLAVLGLFLTAIGVILAIVNT